MRVETIFPGAAIFLATAAGAQSVTPKSDSGCVTSADGRVECRRVIVEGGDGRFRLDHARMDSAMLKRAVLGIELRPTGTKRDTLGVFVESVTPKGPAETAGVVEGDRIATINGVDLRVGSGDVDDPYTNGLAAHRLTREVQKLTPGSRVTLRVYSGGRFREVQVTAGRASDFMHDGGFRIHLGGPGTMRFNGGPGMLRMEGGPEGMGIDPEHLRIMIEEGMRHEGAQELRMHAPMGAAPIRMPLPARPLMVRRSVTVRI